MTVLIDPPAWPAHGRWWSHLASDVSFDELHAFAAAAGVPPRGFEGDHYDVPQEHYEALVAAGAVPVASRELLRRLVAAGLRRSKRAGERVVASVTTTASGRVDVVTSSRPPRGRVDALVLLLTDPGDAGLLAVDADGHPPRVAVTDPLAGWGGQAPAHPALGPGPVRQLGHLRRAADPPRWQEVEVVLHGELAAGAAVEWHRRPVEDVVAARPLLAPLVDGPFSRFSPG